ncbi:hypothetical protein BKA62DRAFT_670027 [Auriculariales sp. MPI-PUGE-AT-0066]|nr:hypothetical protein BKA62DRAFT_670027 [Auriculariales sp. MPI-PUGE-AT-0066]
MSTSTVLLSPSYSTHSTSMNYGPRQGGRNGGILLNPGTSGGSSMFASSHRGVSASSSESSPLQSRENSVTRKIRFAPLPDPRKADGSDDGDSNEDAGYIASLESSVAVNPTSPLAQSMSLPASPSTPTISLGGSMSDAETTRPRSKSWTAKLLKPLLPKKARDQLSDSLGFGSGLGMPRTTSRDSISSIGSNSTWSGGSRSNRGRRGSTSSNAPLKPTIPLGPPLQPTTSGQRLLNGRVYGAPRQESPERAKLTEPEFVEWGHGGMGSVQHTLAEGSAAADWSKVQGSAQTDTDEGSGLAWARRRREQKEARERLDKERLEREAAEQQQETSTSSDATDTTPTIIATPADADSHDDASSTHEATTSKFATSDVPQIAIVPASSTNSRPDTPTSMRRAPSIARSVSVASAVSAVSATATIKEAVAREAKETDISDHTCANFTLPAKRHAHSQSGSLSITRVDSSASLGSDNPSTRTSSPSDGPSSGSSNLGDDDDSSGEENVEDDDTSTAEDASDDEGEISEERRKSSLAAGVEKLVRHNH